jgi:hypothetical protein
MTMQDAQEQPSKSVQKNSWYEMTIQDAQEQGASRSMIKGKSSQIGPSKMEAITFVSEGATRAGKVADLITKIEPPPSGRSTFLTKREC